MNKLQVCLLWKKCQARIFLIIKSRGPLASFLPKAKWVGRSEALDSVQVSFKEAVTDQRYPGKTRCSCDASAVEFFSIFVASSHFSCFNAKLGLSKLDFSVEWSRGVLEYFGQYPSTFEPHVFHIEFLETYINYFQ